MNGTKLFPSGYWQFCAFVNDRLVTRIYGGYTKREALALFRAWLAAEKDAS